MFIRYIFSILIIFFSYLFAHERKLYVYNWSDYITDNTLSEFEKKTGIKIIYDVFDSNEILEGKLMTGNTGYDIVVPTSNFLARQSSLGIFQPIQKNLLPNYKNLDFHLLKKMGNAGNKYAIPYLWSTTGIGYNVQKVKKALGKDAPVDSWDLIFKIENLKKLKNCGVSFLDSPEEIFSIVLNYLGKNPNSLYEEDYSLATEFLLKLRPYIRYFHSSHHINDLVNGNICVAIGWAGDILQLQYQNFSFQKTKKYDINYSIPKEGTLAFFDMLAIPKGAKNISEIYQFLNYLLEPKVIAEISSKTFYSNINKKAYLFLNKNFQKNSALYPPLSVISKIFLLKPNNLNAQLNRFRTRSWIRVKSGL